MQAMYLGQLDTRQKDCKKTGLKKYDGCGITLAVLTAQTFTAHRDQAATRPSG